MSQLSIDSMRAYLARSYSSLNRNKLNGVLAEVDLRRHLGSLNLGSRVSRGGWIARRDGPGEFGHRTAVFFPEILQAGRDYPTDRAMPEPDRGLHTICATFHQTGVHAYFCAARIANDDDPMSITWEAVQLGTPVEQPYQPFPDCVGALFRSRDRNYNFLRYNANVSAIPEHAVAEEFAKEHLRVTFQSQFMSEIADVDGIFWGQQFTYPLEIKEKTPRPDTRLGDYFGLDVGPFVKLAFYAAKHGNLHSLFVVREINNTQDRHLVNWWFITFDRLAQFASWQQRGGGTSMQGTASSVVRIPKCEFEELNAAALAAL